MLPTELGYESTTTTSERRVHQALSSSDLVGTALHSLNLPEHQYKLTAELDFVLVLEALILVIEVKGGQVSCRAGVWTYSDRAGHYRESREGPFQQATSGMYALRDRLRQRLGERWLDGVAFGSLVVTPDVDLASSFEWADETYCGRGPFDRGIGQAVRRAEKYWLTRQPGARRLDHEARSRIVRELRPDFDRSPLLDARAKALDAAFVRLTDEQFSRLDLISEAPRVLCSGGAGTGKTLLAAETARRQALSGRSVLFTCRSDVFAANASGVLAGTGVTVRARSDLGSAHQFEVLVVDEAQDFMSLDGLGALESSVVGGLAAGRWIMFMDQNRQAHLFDDFDPEALQLVGSLGAVPARLRANCRNTREIAFQTRALTGADTGVASAGSGPEVEYVEADDSVSEALLLDAHLRRLRDEGVAPGDITIVSMRGDWETSAARETRSARKGRIRRLDTTNAAAWPGDEVTWASVLDIKGLENRFVCVIDIDALDSERDVDMLYVALSRPRAGLWVSTSRAIGAQMAELYKVHAAEALEALRAAST